VENTHDKRVSKHQKLRRGIGGILKWALIPAIMYLLFVDNIALKALTGITDVVYQIGVPPEDPVALLAIPFLTVVTYCLLLFLFD
jgi:hypothetical protein